MIGKRILSAAGIAALILLSFGAAAWAASVTIKVHSKAPIGEYLTNGQGRPFYIFTADKGGKSACTGNCAKAWPPVLTSGVLMPESNAVKAPLLGTVARGHERQVTYNGMPLYYFIRDKAPGALHGEGINHFGGSWYVVSPAGKGVLPNGKAVGSSW